MFFFCDVFHYALVMTKLARQHLFSRCFQGREKNENLPILLKGNGEAERSGLNCVFISNA